MVGVLNLQPPEITGLVARQPRELVPAVVVPRPTTVAVGDPRELGNRVRQRTEVGLLCAELLFGAAARIGRVGQLQRVANAGRGTLRSARALWLLGGRTRPQHLHR